MHHTDSLRVGLFLTLVCLCPGVVTRAHAQSYTVTELGLFSGDFQSLARAINNAGQVAGTSHTNGAVVRGFLWDPSIGLQDLGSLGGVFTSPAAVNDSGTVTGLSYVSDLPTNYHGFVWDDVNGMQDLGSFGSRIYDTSNAFAINDAGMVVGTSRLETGFTAGFVWTADDGLIDLSDVLDAPIDAAVAINNVGQMVVTTAGAASLYDDGMLIPIGNNLTVHAMNDAGQVVGIAGPAATGQPFVWNRDQGMQVLKIPDPFQFGEAFGINNDGVVVGTMGYRQGENSVTRGFVWTDGTARDVSSEGWTIIAAKGINDKGQIAASGMRMSQPRALLLTPQ